MGKCRQEDHEPAMWVERRGRCVHLIFAHESEAAAIATEGAINRKARTGELCLVLRASKFPQAAQ